MRTDSLAFRLVAGAALWSVAVLVAGGILLSSLFRDAVETTFDDRLRTLLESLLAASAADPAAGLSLARPLAEPRFDQAYSGLYWQIDGPLETLRSRSLFDQALTPPEVPPGEHSFVGTVAGPDGQTLRILTQDIALPGFEDRFRYSIAADLSEMTRQVRRFNGTLIWSLSALGIGLVAAMLVQVRFGLQPLRRLRSALAGIRQGHSDRLEGRFPAELAPLADELNALMAHNAAIVERARTHVGNLAHALKTPLSVLTNEANTDAGTLAVSVGRQTSAMRRLIDHHLTRARTAASGGVLGARTPVADVVEDLRRTLLRIYATRSVTLTVDCPQQATFRGDRHDLEEMIGNLLDNACKWAAGEASIHVTEAAGSLEITVADDGPGLSEEAHARVLERGARLDESVPGSGLGLAIVQDIVGLYGGDIAFSAASLGGLQVVLTFPTSRSFT